MNRWILIALYTLVVLGFSQTSWAQSPSPAAWLRSTGQTQVEGEELYNITLSWQHGVVTDNQPAASDYDVYRCPIGQDRDLSEYDLVGTTSVDQSDPNITYTDAKVTRGAYYYIVKGRIGMSVGDPSPRCMAFAPGAYCINMSDPVLTFISSPKTEIEAGTEYEYVAFARHRSARVQGFVRYELVNGPENMSVNDLTGAVTWSVPADLDEPVAVKIRAWSHDDKNAESFQEWGIRPTETFEIMIGSTTSVREATLLSSFIAPNPASSMVTLQLTSIEPATVLVVDLTGTIVLEERVVDSGLLHLPVESLSPGQYTVVVQQGIATQSTSLMIVR